MLRDEIELYESLTGKDANSVSVGVIGAFLDGYEIGKKENEPKKGEWIKVNPEIRGYTDFFRCSTCLAIIQLGRLTKACDYIFCPYCSADMREV